MAISKINTRALANDSVTTDKVADNAITTDMVASGEIGVTDLADGSITNAKVSTTAAIAASKVNLSSIAGNVNLSSGALQIGGTTAIDSSQNIGVGVAPDTRWTSTYPHIDLDTGGAVYGTSTGVSLAANLYFDGSNWKNKVGGSGGNLMAAYNGGYYFYKTTSQTNADTTVALSERLRVDDNVDLRNGTSLQIGGTTVINSSQVGFLNEKTRVGTGATYPTDNAQLYIQRANNNPYIGFFSNDGSRNAYLQSVAGGNMIFGNQESGGWEFNNGTSGVAVISNSGTLTTPTLITGAYGAGGSSGDGFRLNSTDLYGQIDAIDKVRIAVNGNSFLNGGNVGIGEPSPSKKLTVKTSTSYDGALISNTHAQSAARLQLNNNDSKSLQIDMGGSTQTTYGPYIANTAAIVANSAPLNIGTDSANQVAFYTNLNERMVLDASGTLLVGQSITTVPGAGNTTAGTSIRGEDGVFISRTTSDTSASALQVNKTTGLGAIINIASGGSTVGIIGSSTNIAGNFYIAGSSGLQFRSDDILPTNGSGVYSNGAVDLGDGGAKFRNLYLSSGVVFGDAGGSGTSSSNTLNSYEEGSWSPYWSSTGATFSYLHQFGNYVKVGNMVHAQFYLRATASGTTSNSISMQGFPFASADLSPFNQWGGSAWISNDINSTLLKSRNTTTAIVYKNKSGTPETLDAAELSGVYFVGSVSYRTA